MPNAKRSRRARERSEPESLEIPPCVIWLLREILPLMRRLRPPRSRSREHFRNATIEFLLALRTLLDETIEWLRDQAPTDAELKRIKISDE